MHGVWVKRLSLHVLVAGHACDTRAEATAYWSGYRCRRFLKMDVTVRYG